MNNINQTSIYNPTKAKLHYRIAGFILDTIVFIILLTGLLYLLSAITRYDKHSEALHNAWRDIGYEIYNEETKEYEIISEDDPNFDYVMELYMDNETIANEEHFINSFSLNAPLISIVIALSLSEILMPLIFRNGQTIGMKCFHIGLLSNNNIAVKPMQVFIRGLLGKIVVLTLIPFMGIFYAFFNVSGGFLGTIIFLIVTIGNIILLCASKKHIGFQDLLASVYPVDASQTIFYKTEKELQEALLIEDKTKKSQKKVY